MTLTLTLGGNHTANPRTLGTTPTILGTTPTTLGVLYPLLVVEGQAAPEPQGLESRYGCVVRMWGFATPGRPQRKSASQTAGSMFGVGLRGMARGEDLQVTVNENACRGHALLSEEG